MILSKRLINMTHKINFLVEIAIFNNINLVRIKYQLMNKYGQTIKDSKKYSRIKELYTKISN